jgi:hypothetical protein
VEKLDRLGWVEGISLQAYGLRIGIRSTGEGVMERAIDYLPYGWKPSPSPRVDRLFSIIVGGKVRLSNIRRFNLLYDGAMFSARSLDLKNIFVALESDVSLYVAGESPKLMFLHSGVVGWGDRAILIPGSSYSGKSTLVKALVKRGATYYSDEYAVLDSHGRVHPFPIDLSLRKGKDGRPLKYSPRRIGAQVGNKPLPVGLVVLSEYRKDARWRPRQLSPGQTVLSLLENAMSARKSPSIILAALGRVATRARVLKGVRGEASEVAQYILKEMSHQ